MSYVKSWRFLVLTAELVFLAVIATPLLGQTLPEEITVRKIRTLSSAEANTRRAVYLRGVVTVLSGWKSSFFLDDGTSGISVDRVNDSPELHPGDKVEVRGVTSAGLFAPLVIAEHVTVRGKQRLPSPKLFGPSELMGGKEDSQWLAIRGIVRSSEVQTSWGRAVLFLNIDVGGGTIITARVHDFTQAVVNQLSGAQVTVRGVCGTAFNDRRQFIGIRLFVSSLDDVMIDKPRLTDPFSVPLRPLGSLFQFDQDVGAIDQVRVQGIATYTRPGEGYYLQAGSEGMFVLSRQNIPMALGSQIEVVGYPVASRYSPILDESVFRLLGQTRPPDPIFRSASDMIVVADGFSSAPYDSVLVQLKGKLIEEVREPKQDLLLLQDGSTLYSALLFQPVEKQRRIAVGSLLTVTGICRANADGTHEAHSFEILVRSPADIIVIGKPAWWRAYAGWIVLILLTTLFLMFVWLLIAKRQAGLRALAATDPLTGLFNRRGFLLLAEQQWRLSLRGAHPFLLIYIDVDEFKQVNDLFGHKEGDMTLKAVSDLLRECFRKADILGRLGGDEFAVAAIEATEPSRMTLQTRLEIAVRQHNEKRERKFDLSLSVGILACDSSIGGVPIEDLLARADTLMYEQKRARKVKATYVSQAKQITQQARP